MTLSRPFHRIRRDVKEGHNFRYSSWAYISDPEYARDGGHYVRAYILIQNDLLSIFEYVEPSGDCLDAFSYRIHALLMRTCIELEANFKAILTENICTSVPERDLTMKHYRKVDETHHLSSYEVMLPIWNGLPPTLRPFEVWKPHRGVGNVQVSLPWYRAYNESKHDRHSNFKKANLDNLINAVAGLLVLLASQFGEHEFSAGRGAIGAEDGGVDQMNPSIGSLFRIRYPNDWADSELYEFDWSQIRSQADRFNKLNYDLIPC